VAYLATRLALRKAFEDLFVDHEAELGREIEEAEGSRWLPFRRPLALLFDWCSVFVAALTFLHAWRRSIVFYTALALT
jgi:hypothetical protein